MPDDQSKKLTVYITEGTTKYQIYLQNLDVNSNIMKLRL